MSRERIPLLCALAVVAMVVPPWLRGGEEPPESRFLAAGTVEVLRGEIPLVIAAPHGGRLRPGDLPDRTSGVVTRDAETDSLARELAAALARRHGAWPHLVVCHLHRSKVDCNRDVLTGTGGDPGAVATWRAFHQAIEEARKAAGGGLFLDLHGHSHPVARVELGYLLSASDLRESGKTLAALGPSSSLAGALKGGDFSFEELLRGRQSLGALLQDRGFPAVPSPDQPDPGEQPYFPGGFNTARYGAGAGWVSLQVECPKPGVRDSPENRSRFAEALAESLDLWMERFSPVRWGKEVGK